MSLKDRIYRYLSNNKSFINGGEIEKLAMGAGYKASNSSRRLRELYNEGKIDRKYDKKSVWYKYK